MSNLPETIAFPFSDYDPDKPGQYLGNGPVMTSRAQEAARGLAVAYRAFFEAIRDFERNPTNDNATALVVWTDMLRDRQAETGIVLVRRQSLEHYRQEAERILSPT